MRDSSRVRGAVLSAVAVLVAVGAALLAHNSGAAQSAGAGNPATPEFYTEQVRPVFQANCYRCHSGFNHHGGLQLDTREHVLHGGKDGPVIVPGHPEQSLLVELIRHEGPAKHPMPMPPKNKLSQTDIATITRWVQAGALMPADTAR